MSRQVQGWDAMDSNTYRAAVRARLAKELNKLRIRIAGEREIKAAIRELVEQHLSINEAENLPRWQFNQALLERACEACRLGGDPNPSADTVVRAAINEYYPRALEITPEILKKVFEGQRRRKP